MSKGFTMFLGAAEVAGSLGVTFGVLTQLAAAGLILLMLGAIQKKIFVWRTGFWGNSGESFSDEMIYNARAQFRVAALVAPTARKSFRVFFRCAEPRSNHTAVAALSNAHAGPDRDAARRDDRSSLAYSWISVALAQ